MFSRISFGFHNPNHAAALVCALLPLCWDWRRTAWIGRGLAIGLFAALLLTQSRTGLIVATLEWAAWRVMRRRKGGFHISDLRSRMGFRGQRAVFNGRLVAWLGKRTVAALVVGMSLWWLWSRLTLDGSILNRPKIWLAGLRPFAANSDGVGLGNSGSLVSAFLLPNDIPEVRTLIISHLTLLAEGGWFVGGAWFMFIALAVCGVRRRSRIGLAFAGLVLSASVSTVFDWPVLFDFASQGSLGVPNWILSWLTFALFLAFGARLIIKPTAFNTGNASGRSNPVNPVNPVRKIPRLPSFVISALVAAVLAGALVFVARCVPPGNAPRVQGGYAAFGAESRTLALYDDGWSLRAFRARAGANAILPIHPVGRFPRDFDFSSVNRVLLFGDCREWAYLVLQGIPVLCADD